MRNGSRIQTDCHGELYLSKQTYKQQFKKPIRYLNKEGCFTMVSRFEGITRGQQREQTGG